MLTQVADGVFVRASQFMRSNAVVVQGAAGVLLIDPGILEDELVELAQELRELGQPVVAGFSTHPHWDHLLWHAGFGDVPRYGTAACAGTVRERLPDESAKERVRALMPPDIVDHVPLQLLGEIDGLPPGTAQLPWDGPRIRIVEHAAHASGHAALLIEERGVLVAGDMLSDILIPMLDLRAAADPLDDYARALELLERAATGADVVVPGHGSVGRGDELPRRIEQDRAYLAALRERGAAAGDPRLHSSAYGKDFLPAVHQQQLEHTAG